MKMRPDTFDALTRAVHPFMRGETMRERWDALWESGYSITRLYAEGLNDDHIDTALRQIQAMPPIEIPE